MEDVLDVYHQPYDPAYPVVCMDETSKQQVKEVRQPLPAAPGQAEHYDSERSAARYERNGVSNLFLFFEPLRGWRHIEVTDQRTAVDWAHQIQQLVEVHYPDAERITLVMDNLNTHTPAALYQAFAPAEARRIRQRLELHYTPKHGSWLNMAEIEFSAVRRAVLSKQCLDRRIPDQATLRQEVAAWEAERNACATAMHWRFTTAEARVKLHRLYPTVQS